MASELLAAFATALRPIIKLMLRDGVDAVQFTALARAVYVSVAQDEEFALRKDNGQPRRITHSRISMLTGISRKDVKQILEEGEIAPRHASTNRAVKVLTGWVMDQRFHDDAGEPRSLSYVKEDSEPSFEELVQKYSADTTARVILDELIHVGCVKQDKAGCLHLVTKSYIPARSHEEMIEVGSRALADLADTVAYNILRPEKSPTRLQRTVFYDDVPAQGASFYRTILKNDAEEFLIQQKKNLSSFDRSITPDVEGTGRYRVAIGIYYSEQQIDEETDQ